MSLNDLFKKLETVQKEVGIICLILLPLYYSDFIATKANEYWSSFCTLGFKYFCGSTNLNSPGEIAEGFLAIFLLFSIAFIFENDPSYIPKTEYGKKNPK